MRAESCDSPPGSEVATIVTEADDVRIHKQHFVMSGGADAALARAEAHLDKLHAELKKTRTGD